ncbi:inositol monophosphatase family protein [Facklamia sp. DSM 111018]|uniref:Inositol monophosphatase family protein n=1 Tax=Facklamia lactis TaxID=2749967 RepID=A0ABS0LR55_9LACT|nr:inositol monophosphatase family protein [Facklamia lactis]MBG9981001.1 inositol monophosphatase family protein [Facklamia lactis]MBG9986636.1 inositol monophosphatase family protein [Facklamia lactis]
MDYQLHNRVLTWLQIAGNSLRQSFNRTIQVSEKTSPRDLVTEMDQATQDYLVQQIQTYYPDHQILGEEEQADRVNGTEGMLWIIDPIDGTLNFVKQQRFFGIMIGIYQEGQPIAGYIYDVMQDDLYYGIVNDGVYHNQVPLDPLPIESLADSLIVGNVHLFVNNDFNARALLEQSLGVRSYGCSAYEMIAVIRGEAGLYLSAGLCPWDFAAGYAILTAMGYAASQPDGQALSLLERCPGVFAHPTVYQEAMQLMNP